jgi:hypothetical protein
VMNNGVTNIAKVIKSAANGLYIVQPSNDFAR